MDTLPHILAGLPVSVATVLVYEAARLIPWREISLNEQASDLCPDCAWPIEEFNQTSSGSVQLICPKCGRQF